MSARQLHSDPAMEMLNARLNESEDRLRRRIGAQRVNALIEQFRVAALLQPRLFWELYAKSDPYRWLAQHWAPKQQRRDH